MSAITSSYSLACYGCVDFANNERTLAYYNWACANGMFPGNCRPTINSLCFCPDDEPDTPYVDPITDGVCWYDPAVPESGEFLGVIVLNDPVKGNSTFSREVTDGFVEGSILQRPRLRGRSFAFEVLLVATSCEGMAFGKEWLRRLLEDTLCNAGGSCQSCFGRELSLRRFCPDGTSTDNGVHSWLSVGAIDGPQTVEESARRECCCVLQKMTFTLQSESPYSFGVESELCSEVADPETNFIRCFDWNKDCLDCGCASAVECDRCKYDPVCTCFPFTIPEPVIEEGCGYCEPFARIVQCCCTNDLPAGYDSAFRIQIYSGVDVNNPGYLNTGMRNFQLKIYENPRGIACITDDDSYDVWCGSGPPCAQLQISYIPADSTLTIDGRTNRITLECQGVCRPYDHVVTDATGPIFPLVSRCVPLMICAEFALPTTQTEPAASGVLPASVSVSSFLRFRN